MKKYKTKFIPVDSEHFSIWSEIKDKNRSEIKKIYLTASGGPLLNFNFKYLSKVRVKDIIKHPTWKMGKKISVDSATMMNKCFEVMEAKNIFNLNYDQISIAIHPDSYIHALIEYQNGISKAIIHETTMKIPISNSINLKNNIYDGISKINFKKMNNLKFQKVSINKYPIINLLKILPNDSSLFDTAIVSVNDFIVNEFLNNKISYKKISKLILKILRSKEFTKYKKIIPKEISQIINLDKKIKFRLPKLLDYN